MGRSPQTCGGLHSTTTHGVLLESSFGRNTPAAAATADQRGWPVNFYGGGSAGGGVISPRMEATADDQGLKERRRKGVLATGGMADPDRARVPQKHGRAPAETEYYGGDCSTSTADANSMGENASGLGNNVITYKATNVAGRRQMDDKIDLRTKAALLVATHWVARSYRQALPPIGRSQARDIRRRCNAAHEQHRSRSRHQVPGVRRQARRRLSLPPPGALWAPDPGPYSLRFRILGDAGDAIRADPRPGGLCPEVRTCLVPAGPLARAGSPGVVSRRRRRHRHSALNSPWQGSTVTASVRRYAAANTSHELKRFDDGERTTRPDRARR